jgi:hypothetical protein
MPIRKGIKLLEETEGDGDVVQRQRYYLLSIRFTLNKGDIVPTPPLSFLLDINQKLHEDGFFDHCTRINRDWLRPGLFYAVQGMRVGGYRKVSISPHLAYGENGLPGVIPPNARLIAEIKVLREADEEYRSDQGALDERLMRRLEELRREQPDWPRSTRTEQ